MGEKEMTDGRRRCNNVVIFLSQAPTFQVGVLIFRVHVRLLPVQGVMLYAGLRGFDIKIFGG